VIADRPEMICVAASVMGVLRVREGGQRAAKLPQHGRQVKTKAGESA